MTRGEEIYKVAKRYHPDSFFRVEAFEEGARWADEHPKNPWISVIDKHPFECEGVIRTMSATKPVLVCTCSLDLVIARMVVINGIWTWVDENNSRIDTIIFWMPIPPLP